MKLRSKFITKTVALSLVVAVLLSFAAPLASATPGFPFTDVPETHWGRSHIEWAYENEITSGLTATTFGPGRNVTRGQFATFLWRHAGEPEAPAATFPDAVPTWAQDAVNWAAYAGIVTGYADGTFRATRSIARQEIVTMLYRYVSEVLGVTALQPENSLEPYTDSQLVSGWAVEYMRWGAHVGIIGAGGTLNPRGNANRAATVTMLFRAVVPGFVHLDVIPRAYYYVNEWINAGSNFSPINLLDALLADGFSREEAMQGVEAAPVDWAQLSSSLAGNIANIESTWGVSPSEMEDLLSFMRFTQEEIENAMARIDWNQQARFVAAHLSWWSWTNDAGNRRNPTAEELNPQHDPTCPDWTRHSNLVWRLYNRGFTEEQAVFGARNRAPISTMAVRAARSELTFVKNNPGGISRANMISLLVLSGLFTEAEAAFGVDNINADWNAQAVSFAQNLLLGGGISRLRLIETLLGTDSWSIRGGFTQAQADHAANFVDADTNWNDQALMAALNMLYFINITFENDDIYRLRSILVAVPSGMSQAHLEFSLANLQLVTFSSGLSYLQGEGFTAAQVTHVITTLNEAEKDWNAQAVAAARGVVASNSGLTHENLIEILTATTTSTWTDDVGATIIQFPWAGGFTQAQAQYAAEHVLGPGV